MSTSFYETVQWISFFAAVIFVASFVTKCDSDNTKVRYESKNARIQLEAECIKQRGVWDNDACRFYEGKKP